MPGSTQAWGRKSEVAEAKEKVDYKKLTFLILAGVGVSTAFAQDVQFKSEYRP